jgi:hypothetical protein
MLSYVAMLWIGVCALLCKGAISIKRHFFGDV